METDKPVGPAGKLPIAQEWHREKVYYEGQVVTYDGATYQALHDTGEPPDNEAHWICLAAPGRDAKSFAIAAPSKMMLSIPRTTSSRSPGARFWRSTTSPVYVPVPAGNYCVRRANAARQENRDRGVP
jgi:hypothetical protein